MLIFVEFSFLIYENFTAQIIFDESSVPDYFLVLRIPSFPDCTTVFKQLLPEASFNNKKGKLSLY